MMIKFYVWAVVLCFYSESAQVSLQGMRDQIIPFSQEEAIRECIQLENKLFKFNEIILANHSTEANYKTSSLDGVKRKSFLIILLKCSIISYLTVQ